MSGKNIILDSAHLMINGKQEWSRDDIVIMQPNISESDTTNPNYWRRSVASIESELNIGTAQARHDWVLIRPYYDAEINYLPQNSRNVNVASGKNGQAGVMHQVGASQLSFGTLSSYTYTLTLHSVSAYDGGSLSGVNQGVFRLYLSDDVPLTASNYATEAKVIIEIGDGVNTWVWLNSSGQLTTSAITTATLVTSYNLCKEGTTLYYYVRCGFSAYNNFVVDMDLHCEADATTSRVPCTVYYYP